jgi:hypothetical protein
MPEQLRGASSGVGVVTERDRFFDAGIRSYRIDEHTYDFAKEWAAVALRLHPLNIHLPPYAAAGAMFVLDARTGRLARSAPLALSVLARRSWYLRAAVHHLGLLPARDSDLTSVLEAFASAASSRGWGRTLEYALVTAADLYLTWSDPETANDLLRRAQLAGGRRAPFYRAYIEYLSARDGPTGSPRRDEPGRASMSDKQRWSPMLAGLLFGLMFVLALLMLIAGALG